MNKREKYGFTLIELLVVIGIIAILFAVVLVAINPNQRFRDTRNARRIQDVQSILNATLNYVADNKGSFPQGLPDDQCVGTKSAASFESTDIPSAPADANAFWRFESTNPVPDVASSGATADNAVTITEGSPQLTTGRFGNGLMFDGKRQDAKVASSADIASAANETLEAWIKPTNTFSLEAGQHLSIVDKGDYSLFIDSSTGALTLALNDTGDPKDRSLDASATGYIITSFAQYNGNWYAGSGGQSGASDGTVLQWQGGSNWVTTGFPSGRAELITSLANYRGKLYAALGGMPDGGKVYVYDGTSWTNAFDTGTSAAQVLFVAQDRLYVGAGGAVGQAAAYELNNNVWRQLGSAISGSLAVRAFAQFNGVLYAGTGGGVNGAQVWSWNGTSWTSTSLGSSRSDVFALKVYKRNLYAGAGGISAGDAEIRQFNGSSWGGNLYGSVGNVQKVLSFTVYNGIFYAGVGGAGTTERKIISSSDGSTWSSYYDNSVLISGDTGTGIRALNSYQGILYAGEMGSVMNSGDILWFGDNKVIQSSKRSWSKNQWYHVAATYDGTSAVLYINGHEDGRTTVSMTLDNRNLPLYIGYDGGNGFFSGTLDNVALYQKALTSAEIASHAGCYDLGNYLVPSYLAKIPTDPSVALSDGTDSGYRVSLGSTGTITVTAPSTELNSNQQAIIGVAR